MKNTSKNINFWSASSIGVGGMIGAGIFSILGTAGKLAGSAVFISFMIACIIALLCAYSFAKLGAAFPSAGGPIEFLVKGLGDNILTGAFNIMLWVGYIFALALYANAFGAYAVTFFSEHHAPLWNSILSVLVILVFTGINFIGAKAVGQLELVIVAIKIVILLLFACSGLFFINPDYLSPSQWPPILDIFYGAGLVFLAFEGFGLITNAAEEMENPKRTLPHALYASVLFTGLIYILVSLAVMGNLSTAQVAEAKDYALAAAAKPFLGSIGFKIIAIAALFSVASAVNATLYGGANVCYNIARHGELPEIFERKIWRNGKEGLFVTSGLVIFFALFFKLDEIAMMGSTAFLIIYATVNVSHFFLYKQTGAKLSVIILSFMGCITFLGILIFYEIRHSKRSLWTLLIVMLCSFLIEAIYRICSSRKIQERYIQTNHFL
jgi:amino acid transporter